ncbi:unnamed protein product, partial [Allacma fusca]
MYIGNQQSLGNWLECLRKACPEFSPRSHEATFIGSPSTTRK